MAWARFFPPSTCTTPAPIIACAADKNIVLRDRHGSAKRTHRAGAPLHVSCLHVSRLQRSGPTRTSTEPTRDLFVMHFLLHPHPNPRTHHNFRALPAASKMRAFHSCPFVPIRGHCF